MWRYPFSAGDARLNFRICSESLLVVTLVAGVYYLFRFVPKHLKAGEPVLAIVNYPLPHSPLHDLNRPAYVIPDALDVWDTPAEIRVQVAALHPGDQVETLARFRDWTHVLMQDGRTGWVTSDGLMNEKTHAAEENLYKQISAVPAQARGHAADVDNLRIGPTRRAAVVAQANADQSLEIFDRRLVQHSLPHNTSDILAISSKHPEAWYLVKEGSHAGWILGRHIRLDIPKSLAGYAQETNLVAWLILDTVSDNGRYVPQYLLADRVGTETCDFTGIRVLTWWKKKQTYAIAYKKGGLQGYFPILVTYEGSVPYTHLRLKAADGNRYQIVYGLFDTITRLIGTADTWASDADLKTPGAGFANWHRKVSSLTGG